MTNSHSLLRRALGIGLNTLALAIFIPSIALACTEGKTWTDSDGTSYKCVCNWYFYTHKVTMGTLCGNMAPVMIEDYSYRSGWKVVNGKNQCFTGIGSGTVKIYKDHRLAAGTCPARDPHPFDASCIVTMHEKSLYNSFCGDESVTVGNKQQIAKKTYCPDNATQNGWDYGDDQTSTTHESEYNYPHTTNLPTNLIPDGPACG